MLKNPLKILPSQPAKRNLLSWSMLLLLLLVKASVAVGGAGDGWANSEKDGRLSIVAEFV